MTKNSNRRYKSLKHTEIYRLTIRNNSIKLREEGLTHSSNYIEQKVDKQFPELKRPNYCDSCEIYQDGDNDCNRHVEALRHK